MSEGSKEGSSSSGTHRLVSREVLKTFVDSPNTSESLQAFLKHTSPQELIFQVAAAASEAGGREGRKSKRELGEEEENEDLQLLVKALQKCFACDEEILPSLLKDPKVLAYLFLDRSMRLFFLLCTSLPRNRAGAGISRQPVCTACILFMRPARSALYDGACGSIS